MMVAAVAAGDAVLSWPDCVPRTYRAAGAAAVQRHFIGIVARDWHAVVPVDLMHSDGPGTTLFTNGVSTPVILAGVLRGAVAKLWPPLACTGSLPPSRCWRCFHQQSQDI